MKKQLGSLLAIALSVVAIVSNAATADDTARAQAVASPHPFLSERQMQALRRQAPVVGQSWRDWLLQWKPVPATPLRPEFWTWENILKTFGNDIDRATQQKIAQLRTPLAFENELGPVRAVSAPASSLSSAALGSDTSIRVPAQTWSARFSADLLRPAAPREDAAAGALTFNEVFTRSSSSQSSRALEDYGNSHRQSFSAGGAFDASGVGGGFPSERRLDAPMFTATVGDGGADPDAIGDDGSGGIGGSDDTSGTTGATPEPSTWAAAALAVLALGYMERRRLRALTARLTVGGSARP